MALTAKQEAFALAVASGMNQSDAYRSAYDTKPNASLAAINVNASKVMANAKVRLRVGELRKPAVAAAQYGLQEAMREASEALEVSRRKENGGAMVAAVTLRAKLAGLIIEKRQNVPNPFDGMPMEELEAADAAMTATRAAILNASSGTADKSRARI